MRCGLLYDRAKSGASRRNTFSLVILSLSKDNFTENTSAQTSRYGEDFADETTTSDILRQAQDDRKRARRAHAVNRNPKWLPIQDVEQHRQLAACGRWPGAAADILRLRSGLTCAGSGSPMPILIYGRWRSHSSSERAASFSVACMVRGILPATSRCNSLVVNPLLANAIEANRYAREGLPSRQPSRCHQRATSTRSRAESSSSAAR